MKYFYLILLILLQLPLSAQWTEKGDTIIVQTLDFDMITQRSGTFKFPENIQFEKILMHYTLKCDPRTTQDRFDCGEWDYLTYTRVIDSTGRFDSTLISAPYFRVKGGTPIEYKYTDSPYNYIIKKNYTSLNYGSDLASVESFDYNTQNNSIIFNETADKVSFEFLIFIKSEDIKNSNLSNIEFSEISLNFLNDILIEELEIKLIQTPYNSLDEITNFSFENEISYFKNDVNFIANNWTNLIMSDKVSWNESNNLIIKIIGSYDNNSYDFKLSSDDNQVSFLRINKGNYLWFENDSYVEVENNAFDNINNEITIALWQFGDWQKQPENSFAFEAVNDRNQRVFSSHLPWSNGRVYWDAGNTGTNYDRIDKESEKDNFAGKWNHWAFTKNISEGTMKIYLNGQLWHSGTDKNRTFDKIHRFKIASNGNGYGRYSGGIDNFGVWSKELNQEEIKSLLTANTNNLGPLSDNLLFFFDFDNIQNNKVSDLSGNNIVANIFGLPEIRDNSRQKLFTSYSKIATPALKIGKAIFDGPSRINTESVEKTFTYPKKATQLFIFDYESPDRVFPVGELSSTEELFNTPTDILSVYDADTYTYTFDEDGFKIDSTFINSEKEISNRNINWYSPINTYEIHRFITPYGINLDLGPDGFTWIEDLTDWAPILQGDVFLSAGNQQELIDIKFYMIKGTPARNIKHLTTLWPSGGNYRDIVDNKIITYTEKRLPEDASMFKVITRSSGHGFNGPANTDNCAEFCARLHSLHIDGDKKFEWLGWKECGDLPVYPQGGTWLIDRSDWCPGETVTTHEHEITGLVQAGEVHFFDYEIENPPQYEPYGNYVFTSYLFSYGEPNFQVNASIDAIISPNIHREYLRFNPNCGSPQIVISNQGAENLTSLEIDYGVVGGSSQTYNWKGDLAFLETDTVNLPPLNMLGLEASVIEKFEVNLKNPNGKTDEYPRNNYGITDFETVKEFAKFVRINLRTNNSAEQQYSMYLKDNNDNILFERKLGELVSNTTYQEDIELEPGCYEFYLENNLGYGLDFWFLRSQLGSGSVSISSGNQVQNFNPDFGNYIRYQFTVGEKPEIMVSNDTLDFGKVAIGESKTMEFEIEAANEKGLIINEIDIILGDLRRFYLVEPLEFPIQLAKGETQRVVVEFAPNNDNERNASLVIRSNDFAQATYNVRLLGNRDINNVVDEYFSKGFKFNIENPLYNNFNLEIVSPEFIDKCSIDLFDNVGSKINNLYTGNIEEGITNINLGSSNLPPGIYYIKFITDNFFLTKKISIIK